MAIDLSLVGNLREDITSLTFRNSCGLSIQKAKRETAYTMALDVIIESVDYNLYESGKSLPVTQFYGYATLVFQDCLSLEIPIHFPRQRLYYAVQYDALQQWSSYAPFLDSSSYHRNTILQIEAIKGALNVPTVIEVSPTLWETKWIELPLKEFYIKCKDNTQFTIEYTQYSPIPFPNPFLDGFTVDGKSRQVDGDKDGGLPKNGIQPARNPQSDPFKGNRPTSPVSDIIGGGLNSIPLAFLSQLDGNNVVADRKATPDVEGWYIELPLVGLDGVSNGSIAIFTQYVACFESSIANVAFLSQNQNIAFACGTRSIDSRRITVSGTSYTITLNYLSSWALIASKRYGKLPPNSAIQRIPNGICQ